MFSERQNNMKKLSVILAFVIVLAMFVPVSVSAAEAVPVLVYEPYTMTYTPGETVELKTVAKGSGLSFSWLVNVSTDSQDYTFDFSKEAGVKAFEALDKSGKMKAKMSVSSVSEGKMTAVLTLQNLAVFDYGVFVTCTVANGAGSKDTDRAALYPSYSAPPMPEIEIISELDVRIGKLIKLACNVYPPDGVEYDNIEYVWYTTPDGDKSSAVKIEGEDYSVLVVDTGAAGIYFYYCSVYIQQGASSYYYESAVTMIRVHEPVMDVTYSSDSFELGSGETADIKVTVRFENSDEKGTLSYQWMSGDNNIPGTYTPVKGATSDTLTVKGADKEGKKYYCCVVKNEIDGYEFSNDSSDIPIVIVTSTGEHTPEIFMHPQDAYATEGDEATFAVDASYAASYEWYMVKPGGTTDKPNTPVKLKNGSNGVVSGAETSILKIKASAENNGCLFYCQVYGLNGKYVSTNNAKLNVNLIPPTQPKITKQPESVKAYFGDKITLSAAAEASDGGELRYQWYSSDKAEYPQIKAVIDANSKTFEPKQDDAEKYYCVAVWNVKNGMENGPVYSNFAKVELSAKETETETDKVTETDEATETEAGISTDTETDAGTVTETEGAPATQTEGAASDENTSGAVSEGTDGGDMNMSKLVIILLAIIIALLTLALAGAVVFIIIKSKKKKGNA